MLGALGLLALSAYKKETENISVLSYYPDLKGDNPYVAEAGSYVDPGVEANGVDVTSDCTITGLDDPAVPGVYNVQYEYLDPNGIKLKVSREVRIKGAGDNISGEYTIKSFVRAPGDITAAWRGRLVNAKLLIWKSTTEPGIYYIQDLLLGHYMYGANYGARYASTGLIKVDDENNVTMVKATGMTAWGDTVDWLKGTYDPATKTFKLESFYGPISRGFTVTLTLE